MNLIELKNSVTSLIFDNEIENYDLFLQAVNRSVYRARMNFPKSAVFTIPQYPIRNLLGDNHFQVYEIPKEIVFEVNDILAFSFECYGIGKMEIKWFNPSAAVNDFEIIQVEEFDSRMTFSVCKGFVKRFNEFVGGRFLVTFKSEYAVKVKNIAFYDRLISRDISDIPEFSPMVKYDLGYLTRDYCKKNGVSGVYQNFMCLKEIPKLYLLDNFVAVDYVMNNAVIEIPRSVVGQIRIEYLKYPDTVGTGSLDSDIIDVTEEIAEALSYLVASTMLLDEDDEKANFYLRLYSEAEANAMHKDVVANQIFQNTRGWC